MTEQEAVYWEKEREKGKLRWVLRHLLLSLIGFSALYLVASAIGWELNIGWLFVWTILGMIWNAYSWSDIETRFAALQQSHVAAQRSKAGEVSRTGNQ